MLELFYLQKKSSTREGFAFLEFLFSAVNCQINSIDIKIVATITNYIIILNFRQLCHTESVNFISYKSPPDTPHPPHPLGPLPTPPLALHPTPLPFDRQKFKK